MVAVKKAGLLDRFRTLIGVERRSVSPSQTAGTSGASIIGGFVQSREKDSSLAGSSRYRTFSELLANVSIIAASVRYFLSYASSSAWHFDPPKDGGAEGQRLAEEVDRIFRRMETPWHRVVRRSVGYRFYGFSVAEWIAQRGDDGVIGFRDIAPRPQSTIERWDIDRAGRVAGMTQRVPETQEEIYLPRSKTLYVVDDSIDDSPEGLGLFRHCVDAGRRLRRYEELEGVGFETDLKGIPIGRAPLSELERQVKANTMTSAERDAALLALKTLCQNHVRTKETAAIFDSMPWTDTGPDQKPTNVPQWGLDLLNGDSQSFEAIANSIDREIRALARVLGTEHLLLGETGAGSMALSKDKSQNFAVLVNSALTDVAESVERDLIATIFRLNGWPDDLRPEAKFERVQLRDVEAIATSLADIARAAPTMDPDDEIFLWLRDLLGAPRPPEVSELARDASLMGRETEEEEVETEEEA